MTSPIDNNYLGTMRDCPCTLRDYPNAMREAPYLASPQEVKSNSRDKRSDVAAAERQQAGCSHVNPATFPQPTDHTSVHPSAHLDTLLYLITVLRGLGLVLNQHLYSFSSYTINARCRSMFSCVSLARFPRSCGHQVCRCPQTFPAPQYYLFMHIRPLHELRFFSSRALRCEHERTGYPKPCWRE